MRVDATVETSAQETRREWVKPEARTMRAGDAEAGPNPNAPEGVFAFAS